jgi:hypothetical protein
MQVWSQQVRGEGSGRQQGLGVQLLSRVVMPLLWSCSCER